MIAGVYREDMAVATGSEYELHKWNRFRWRLLVTYLFRTTGQVLGVSLSGAILQGVLLQRLRLRISGPDAHKVFFFFFFINERYFSYYAHSSARLDYLRDSVSISHVGMTRAHRLRFIDIPRTSYPIWIPWHDKQQLIPMPTLCVLFSFVKLQSISVAFSRVYRFKKIHYRE